MKFKLKNAFFSILILIAIPLVIALFIDNEYKVENEIIIQQPKAVVFDYVKSLRNQDRFNKWANIEEQSVPLDLFLHGKVITPK